jgi:SAM-dependent methyltransferase
MSAWKTLEPGAGSAPGSYDPDYYPVELLSLVKWTPARVLDVGCSRGATGRALKQRYPGVHVTGIEPEPVAAAEAARHLDQVHARPLEQVPVDAFPASGFDTVVLADVLEHLYNPWKALLALKPRLAPGGRLLISLPNARNAWLLNELAEGRFTYDTAGLLDVTHVRFFTLHEAQRMLAETGYVVEKLSFNVDERLAQLIPSLPESGVKDLDYGSLRLRGLDRQAFLECLSLQLLLIAKVA